MELFVIGIFKRERGGMQEGRMCGVGRGYRKHISRFSSWVRKLWNMKSMQLPLAAIFFMTYFTGPGEAMPPLAPLDLLLEQILLTPEYLILLLERPQPCSGIFLRLGKGLIRAYCRHFSDKNQKVFRNPQQGKQT